MMLYVEAGQRQGLAVVTCTLVHAFCSKQTAQYSHNLDCKTTFVMHVLPIMCSQPRMTHSIAMQAHNIVW